MHGVPANLNLASFHGATLEYVGLGQYIMTLSFSGDSRPVIGIEGDWELRDGAGKVLDQQAEPLERDAYRIHVLLGKTVTASHVDPPRSFSLRFDSGHTLHVFDRSTQYESFSIQPGNIFV